MNPMFYFLLALTALLAGTANASGPIVDFHGDPLVVGGSYYVLPNSFGRQGGGLTLAPLGGNQCPLLVGQEKSDDNKGIPVKFSNWRSRVGFIPESENLNIEMDIQATICVQSTYWRVTPSGVEYMKWVIEAGEDASFFQIKKTENFPRGYNIAVCPNGNDCKDVGIFVDKDGVRRLALSSKPFPVMFVKATGTETSSKTMSII